MFIEKGNGSVNHARSTIGNGLTDPVGHKVHYNGTYVTDAEQGESSFACSSSGISSCCVSDEESSSSEDDDDSDDDKESFSSNSKKWTLRNGYNLTTFDQTENGQWAINQPLPLPVWAKESKKPMVIEKVNTQIK